MLKGLKEQFIIITSNAVAFPPMFCYRKNTYSGTITPLFQKKKLCKPSVRRIILPPLPTSKFSADVKLRSYFKIFIQHSGLRVHHSPGGNSNIVFIMQTTGNPGNSTLLKASMGVSAGESFSYTSSTTRQLSSLRHKTDSCQQLLPLCCDAFWGLFANAELALEKGSQHHHQVK